MALEQAHDVLGRHRAVLPHLFVELARGEGVGTGERRRHPIGELGRGPPQTGAGGVVSRLAHAGHDIAERLELMAHHRVREPHAIGRLARDAADREALRKLLEQGPRAGARDHDRAPVAHELCYGVCIGAVASVRTGDLQKRRGGLARGGATNIRRLVI